eukprot:Nitzschia sp. Nitz4//scaffold28_size193895//96997//99011//NITZ4_001659-RA/size193895-augustus-gene-0.309-mRNA-1//-1//CDS//3329545964//5951//frame0
MSIITTTDVKFASSGSSALRIESSHPLGASVVWEVGNDHIGENPFSFFSSRRRRRRRRRILAWILGTMFRPVRLSQLNNTARHLSWRPLGSSSTTFVRTKTDFQESRLNKLPPTGTQTKIICTIGPATDKRVPDLLEHGMAVARLNFSHAGTDYTYPQSIIHSLRASRGKHHSLMGASEVLPGKKPISHNNVRAVLVDTKGPEIRTGPLPGNEEVTNIEVGAKVTLTIEDVSHLPAPKEGDTDRVLHIDYMSIARTVHEGASVLLDDGLIALEVVEIDPKEKFVICKAQNAGPIKKNKGVNLPNLELDLPALTEKDKRDLRWACEVGADYIAASFIRNAANVRSVVAFLSRVCSELPDVDGCPRLRPLVISKIENKEGVDNFDEILRESDGIMVARGDLGVEIPYSKVFAAQKMMTEKCNLVGKPVIVATQMLDSMIRNPRPTRAEVTDVGTAVLDGADAVMLSGETAAGAYPIESIRSMASVVHEADMIKDGKKQMLWNQEYHDKLNRQEQELDSIAASAVKAANVMKADIILLISATGRVARAVARHKPAVPVISFCTDVQVARRLQLHRAITPVMLQSTMDPRLASTRMGVLRTEAMRSAKELGFVKSGDRIVIIDRTQGQAHDMFDYSHNMKVVTLADDLL